MAKAKPFIKWAGGKGQLIEQLDALLPLDFEKKENVIYIEPFIGGGAMLFYMLQRYSNIKTAVINDINEDLIGCYKVIRDEPDNLIRELSELQKEYYSLNDESERKQYFLQKRLLYNSKVSNGVEQSALLIFLNRTCFNGLYRVNKLGYFNVPFGKYKCPLICDIDTIRVDSELLKDVEILSLDFENTLKYVSTNSFVYMDPPYRPLNTTSCFNDYSKESFNDDAQIRLKIFCDKIHQRGGLFMLSNSDSSFFSELYSNYSIKKVYATRSINSVASKRGKISEIVVRNYKKIESECKNYNDVEVEINNVAEDEYTYRRRF